MGPGLYHAGCPNPGLYNYSPARRIPRPAMAALGDRLVHLLAGDFVRIECPDLTVTAEVLANEQTGRTGTGSRVAGRQTVRFMPIGEDATAVQADRFHVVVEPGEGRGWEVGPLVAEVFDEAELAYVSEPRGELRGLEVLDLSE